MSRKKIEPAPQPMQQLITVNPATLVVRDQARADATPDEGLIASIRQHGIMQPPVVEPGPREGTYAIVIGHRRVGGAIAAGLENITVILRETPLDSEALTLEQQIVENERRQALTAKDMAAGYSKLSLFGLRPEDIAAGIGEKTARVRAGLAIVNSPKAQALVEDPAIDFEQAATIAEFEDQPKLQQKLIDTATTRPENFRRDVEQARAERRLRELVDGIRQSIEATGTPVLQELTYATGNYWTGKSANENSGSTLDALTDPDGTDLTPEKHLMCDGHAAIIHRVGTYYLDTDNPPEAIYVCTNWKGFGHLRRADTKTPEQLEQQARWDREAEARAERDKLLAANTTARRTWLQGYLATGRLRPTAGHFELMALATSLRLVIRDNAPAHMVLQLLTGEEWPSSWNTEADNNVELRNRIDSGQAAPLRVIVADAIALLERWLTRSHAVKYFELLETWGYALTDTDRELLDAAKAQAAAEAPADDDASADNDETGDNA